MLTTEPTEEMIEKWKSIFSVYHSVLKANRKSGIEIDNYFKRKYPYQVYNDTELQKAASLNITENDYFKNKLPKDTLPNVQCYKSGDVLVAIDLYTGEFHVEGENIEDVILIHDDLFLFRGLDEEDLKNYFLVAEYVKLAENENL